MIQLLSPNGTFELAEESRGVLFQLLHSPPFCEQISQQLGCASVQFLELLFQPVPYSPRTRHGMPPEFEPYFHSAEHAVINVPANFLFKSRISQPSRLCAIYRRVL
ncbi:hypothetical protein [Candidatus Cyanaurora vandensis]|uniref:hypothetical protein n=1 Tax=Candidatus Cyanaurora vandensis TaxID=2714958 RepID=UPI00257B7E6D|nr:hypothetical protein [Candidatus Cyanaurora vandensis]